MDLVQAERTGACPRRGGESGYAMAALLVGLSVMAVLMSMALPVWSTMVKREKEAELIWRGQQYTRAIALFQRKFANTFPPSVDVLVEQRFLRKKYKDPITNDEFQLIPVGGAATPGVTTEVRDRRQQALRDLTQELANRKQQSGQTPQTPFSLRPQTPGSPGTPTITSGQAVGIQGVVSKSKDTAMRLYNGRSKYNEWAFVHVATAQSPGVPQQPGQGGRGGGRGPQPNPFGPNPFQQGGPFNPAGGPSLRPPVPGQPPFPGQPPVHQSPGSPFGPPRRPGDPPQHPPGR